MRVFEALALETGRVSINKKKGLQFEYYTGEAFKELRERVTCITVVGNVRLDRKADLEKDEQVLQLLGNKEKEVRFYTVTDANSSAKALGYIRVGEYEYLRVEKHGCIGILLMLLGGAALLSTLGGRFGVFGTGVYLQDILINYFIPCIVAILTGGYYLVTSKETVKKFIALLLILIGLISGGVFFVNDSKTPDTPIKPTETDGTDWDGELVVGIDDVELKTAEIDIMGLANLIISEKYPTIPLVNMGTKLKCYQQFTVSYDGEELYESDYIKPASVIEWNAYEEQRLPEGKYEIHILIHNFAINKDGSVGAKLNHCPMDVAITVKR